MGHGVVIRKTWVSKRESVWGLLVGFRGFGAFEAFDRLSKSRACAAQIRQVRLESETAVVSRKTKPYRSNRTRCFGWRQLESCPSGPRLRPILRQVSLEAGLASALEAHQAEQAAAERQLAAMRRQLAEFEDTFLPAVETDQRELIGRLDHVESVVQEQVALLERATPKCHAYVRRTPNSDGFDATSTSPRSYYIPYQPTKCRFCRFLSTFAIDDVQAGASRRDLAVEKVESTLEAVESALEEARAQHAEERGRFQKQLDTLQQMLPSELPSELAKVKEQLSEYQPLQVTIPC
eukprot:634102-Prorocentrum_minimum.AAC.8